MELIERIELDYKDLKSYFQKMVEFNKDLMNKKQNEHHHISHYIFPDATINIYSFLEFWLKEICKTFKQDYPLKCNDIKGKNDLDAYNKYFTNYIGLNLSVKNEYQQLNKLRELRNIFIHHGSHVKKMKKELDRLDYQDGKKISGITITILKFYEPKSNDEVEAIITVNDEYIFNRLEDAKFYLENICREINDTKL